MENEEVVNLHLSRGKIFVWNSRGVGVLVRLPNPNATEEDVTTFQEARKHSFEAQKELHAKQIQAKEEARKESGDQYMSERKRRRLEKKQKKRKRDDLPEIGSLEKSDGADHNENEGRSVEGRSVEECAADTKDVEKMSGSSSGMVVEENASVQMESVTWSTSSESNTDKVQSGSTYTTSDSRKEFSPTQVFGDQAICSTLQENQSSSQECDIPQEQNKSTSQGVLGNKKSESVSSGMNTEEVKGTSSTKKDVALSGENQIKKKTGVEKLKSSAQVSDKNSGVSRSRISPPLEGIIVPTTDRPLPKKGKVTKDRSCLVQLFTEAKETNYVEVTDWPFPSTDQEKLRAAVFMHFWEQGYYLTSGLKFGGDFLVYKGSPLLFHSTYIAICIPYEKSMLTQTLITYGRLGPIVKKTVVLCSLNENEEVRCVSLQWSGI